MFHKVTEVKRVARVKNYANVRNLLRAVGSETAPVYRVLTVAGQGVRGDVQDIQHAMPKSRVTAVDFSELPGGAEALAAASKIPGVEVRDLDLFELTGEEFDKPFHYVNLDLCGPVHERLIELVRHAGTKMVVPNGVLSCTFLNGRDSAERFANLVTNGFDPMVKLPDIAHGMRAGMWGRVVAMTLPGWSVESMIYYRSLGSPMVIVTWRVGEPGICSRSFRYDVIGEPDGARAEVAMSAAQKAWVTRRKHKEEEPTTTCRWCGAALSGRRREYCSDAHYKSAWAFHHRKVS